MPCHALFNSKDGKSPYENFSHYLTALYENTLISLLTKEQGNIILVAMESQKNRKVLKSVKIPLEIHIKLKAALAQIAVKTHQQLEIGDFVSQAIIEKIENNQILNN